MKVAIVTPYYKESVSTLLRCRQSVLAQTYGDVTHILVADGHPNPAVADWDCEHIKLPFSHRDAGATPRAIGSLSAFARGYDAVSYLDADNWYDPDHIAEMVGIVEREGAQFVIATRRIHCGIDGHELYTDLHESNGVNMVDTNSMFMTRDCGFLLGNWLAPEEHLYINDRLFWEAVKVSGVRISRCPKSTVAYASRWAVHYANVGAEIPPESVWFRNHERHDQDSFVRHGDLTPDQQREMIRNALGG